MKLSSISCVLPAYNEGPNVERSIKEALEALKKVAETYEVILVNDGSHDDTKAKAESVARTNPKTLRVINHEKNLGYGAALCTGFANAKMDYVFFTDCDGQFNISDIKLLVQNMNGYDIVVGYRVVRKDPPHRAINAWAWGKLIRFVYGLKIRDLNCAFKIFRRQILKAIAPQSNGAFINAEIMAKAKNIGAKIHEVNVEHFPRRAGKQTGANPRVVLRAFIEFFRFWWKHR